MKSRGILGLSVSVVAAGVVATTVFWLWPRAQTEACIATASCLPAYANSAVCETLPIGTSRNELYVRLGQPTRISGTTLFFAPSATESYEIAVVLDQQGNAKELRCRGNG
jgi:hypothetical protein